MKNTFYLFIVALIACEIGHSQSIPADYHNPVVQKGHRNTTDNFMNFLEQGKVDEALSLIDTSFLRTKTKYKDSLIVYYKELAKYLKTTRLSVVIVYPESKYNTYRCRYYNEKGEFFYIDLYYSVGHPNSLIKRIWKKSEKELIKERKELAKRVKEEEKTGPPPPPKLPPPGVQIMPAKKN